MKAVLISINPKWCELIANGKKTIEVRKNRPNLETPFKCYICCTTGKPFLNWHNGKVYTEEKDIWGGRGVGWYKRLNRRVIGEFICDRIYKYEHFAADTDVGLFEGYEITNCDQSDGVLKDCLSSSELLCYGNDKTLYGWHISDLKIYDNPKELSEFERPYDCDSCGAKWASECNERAESRRLTHSPQSWCYVEEI